MWQSFNRNVEICIRKERTRIYDIVLISYIYCGSMRSMTWLELCRIVLVSIDR